MMVIYLHFNLDRVNMIYLQVDIYEKNDNI